MYDLIYNFFIDNLLTNTTLSSMHSTILGIDLTFDTWLAHAFTIISITLIFIFLILFIKWLFKVFAGIILVR